MSRRTLLTALVAVVSLAWPAAAEAVPRIAAVSTANKLLARDGAPLPEWGQYSADVKKVRVSGDRVVFLATNGDLWARDGNLLPEWGKISADVKDFAVENGRIAMIDSAGWLWAQEGPLRPEWVFLSRDASKVVLAGNRILMITTGGALIGRDGDLRPELFHLSRDVIDVAASGSRIAMVGTDRKVWMRNGDLRPEWVEQASGASSVALAGAKLLVVTTDKHLWSRNGDTANWAYLASNVASVAADESLVLMRSTTNVLSVLDDATGAGWGNLSADITDASVTHRYATQWQYGGTNGAIDNDAEADRFITDLRGSNDALTAAANSLGQLAPASRDYVINRMNTHWGASSRAYGGANWKVDADGEADAVVAAMRARSDADALTLYNGLTSDDKTAVRTRANAASTTSVTYGGGNWKVDTEAELSAWASQQQQLDGAGQDWLFTSLATEAERQFVAGANTQQQFGTPTVVAEGPIEVPTAADTASLDDAEDAALAQRQGLDGTSVRGCKTVTYSLPHEGKYGVVFGRAYHEAKYCWNQRKHRAGGGTPNRAWYVKRAAGVSANCDGVPFNATFFKQSWGGYANGAINMEVDMKAECGVAFLKKTVTWRLGIRGLFSASSYDTSYRLG